MNKIKYLICNILQPILILQSLIFKENQEISMDNYHTNISQGEIAIILILSHAIVLLSWGLWRIKYFLLRKVIQAVERGDVHVYHHK